MISAKESILGPFEMKHLAKVVEDNYHFVKNGYRFDGYPTGAVFVIIGAILIISKYFKHIR